MGPRKAELLLTVLETHVRTIAVVTQCLGEALEPLWIILFWQSNSDVWLSSVHLIFTVCLFVFLIMFKSSSFGNVNFLLKLFIFFFTKLEYFEIKNSLNLWETIKKRADTHHSLDTVCLNCQLRTGIFYWHLPSTSTRIKSCVAAAADFQHPLKGVQVESKNEALCALGKTGRTRLQIVRYFQEPILWAQFLYLFISGKVLKSFMVTSAPCD